MPILPDTTCALFDRFAPVLTRPTYRRFLVLLGSAIITTGRRTVANLLRTAGSLAPGHVARYRRVFSEARWSMLDPACALARHLVAHPGPHVYSKARHRDPVRSSHAYTARGRLQGPTARAADCRLVEIGEQMGRTPVAGSSPLVSGKFFLET